MSSAYRPIATAKADIPIIRAGDRPLFAERNLWNIGVRSASFRPDVGLTNNAAIVVVLFTKLSGKIGAAHTDRMKVKGGKLRLDLGCLHRRGKPAGQLSRRFLGRFCRCV